MGGPQAGQSKIRARHELVVVLPDDSVLANAANPPKERYRVEATVGTAIDLAVVRLEALTHPSLPGSGPGREPSGSFVQTSWNVTATSPDREEPIKVEFDTAWADHQSEWDPINADGHWDNWGGHGGNCTAIWSMSNSIPLAADTTLAFEMHCQTDAPGRKPRPPSAAFCQRRPGRRRQRTEAPGGKSAR